MKYKVCQSLQSRLEEDLNEKAEQGYGWVCKLCAWKGFQGQMLFTYLLKKIS